MDKICSLCIATTHRYLDAVKKLIEAGADIHAKTPSDQTPILQASGNGHLEVIDYLLSKGADPGKPNERGWTALLGAVDRGYVDVLQRLLVSMKGKDKSQIERSGWNGYTLIDKAATGGHIAIMDFLRGQGFSLKSPAYTDVSLLHVAAREGHVDFFRRLLEQDVETNVQSMAIGTPLN